MWTGEIQIPTRGIHSVVGSSEGLVEVMFDNIQCVASQNEEYGHDNGSPVTAVLWATARVDDGTKAQGNRGREAEVVRLRSVS